MATERRKSPGAPPVRALIFAVLAMASLCIAACGGKSKIKGDTFEFSATSLGGKTVSSSDARFEGKVVVVDIWGTWCPPCLAQLPTLTSLHHRFADRGLEIVGIAFEKGAAPARRSTLQHAVEDLAIPYTILEGGGFTQVEARLPALTSFGGFPTTIVIGRDGIVRRIETGFSAERARAFEAMVLAVLDEE